MTEDGALKLRLQPDDYLCVWQLPTSNGDVVEVPGSLELIADRSPRGVMFGNVPVNWEHRHGNTSASFPQRISLQALRARLANGYDATIVDADVNILMPEQALVFGRAVLISPPNAAPTTDLRFQFIKVQITGLDIIAGRGPIRKTTWPTSNMSFLEGTWSFEGEPDSCHTWTEYDAELHLEFDGSLSTFDPFFYRMAFSPAARVILKKPVSLVDAFGLWIEPLRKLIMLSTSRRETVTYVSLGLADQMDPHSPKLQVFGYGISQRPYISRQREIIEVNAAFTAARDRVPLLTMLHGWQNLAANSHPLIETYGTMMLIPDLHPRARYLTLVQALEGYHGYQQKKARAKRERQHTKKREEILKELAGKDLTTKTKQFIRDFLAKKPFYSLDDCLKDSFLELPINLLPTIEANPIISALQVDSRQPRGPLGAMRLIRNDLAHGERTYDNHDLGRIAEVLEQVARAHLLRLLGCDDAVLSRVLTP